MKTLHKPEWGRPVPKTMETESPSPRSFLAGRGSRFAARCQVSKSAPLRFMFIASLFLICVPLRAQTNDAGYALRFDGADDFVSVPGFGSAMPMTEVTIEFWQKVDSIKRQHTFTSVPLNNANRLSAH